MADLATRLSSELLLRHSLTVHPQWLWTFLSSTTVKKNPSQPPPPLAVLASTAHFRLLNSDFTQSLVSLSLSESDSSIPASSTITTSSKKSALLLPSDIADVNVQSSILQWNVPVQVLTIADVGSSKWTQIEAIERWERGEEVRGREVIRSVPALEDVGGGAMAATAPAPAAGGGGGNVSGTDGVANNTSRRSTGPHKLLLQDASGTQVYGFELIALPKLFITNTSEQGGTNIGCKIMLKKGCEIRRGMVMLTPKDASVLGGKVEDWDASWRKGRKGRLKAEPQAEQESETSTT